MRKNSLVVREDAVKLANALTAANLSQYEIYPQRGFLPSFDPLDRLAREFDAWEDAAGELPKLLVTGRVRSLIDQLPVLDANDLVENRGQRRAMVLLSFLGHAYAWGEKSMVDRLPACIAVPWHKVAGQLGRPPVLSYASYVLDNWRRIDPNGPIALGNIALCQNFLGGLDEEWFILVHVAIEARASEALGAIVDAQRAVGDAKPKELEESLLIIASTLEKVHGILERMPERCDPYIYYHRVRPYLHGWSNHPALPEGLIYDGVEAYGGQPQKFRGETGAQSSLVPSLDAALNITPKEDFLRAYLLEMRDYMPPAHRAFIESIERGPSIRQFVIENKTCSPSLRDAYNACVDWLERFRSVHLEYAKHYIQKQNKRGSRNPTDVGTGGTPFIPYLTKHRDETHKHLID